MTTELDTATVIDRFRDASYDDLGSSRGVWQTIHGHMIKKYEGVSVQNYKDRALQTVIEDLEVLRRKIDEHLKDAFVVDHSDMGYRYGHYNAIRYILFRWFSINAPGAPYTMEDQVKVPSWFLQCVALINVNPRWYIYGAQSSIEMTDQMLNITTTYRDSFAETEPVKLGTPS